MRKLILFTLVLFFFYSPLSAVNVYWLGGTGNWDNPNKWSTGTVPTVNDDVIASTGTITLTGPAGVPVYVATISLGNAAVLNINAGAILQVSDQQAFWGVSSSGVITINGKLVICDIANGYGMLNSGTLTINPGGVLKIKDINLDGIHNVNKMYNYGQVYLDAEMRVALTMFPNSLLKNYEGGTITISQPTLTGIYMPSVGAEFYNSGTIYVYGGLDAIYGYDGSFENTDQGHILISGTKTGISFNNGYRFVNSGEIDIETAYSGLKSGFNMPGGSFENSSTGELQMVSDSSSVIALFSSDVVFENNGNITAKTQSTFKALHNNSSNFVNNPCAHIWLTGRVENLNSGNILNRGWMNISTSAPSLNSGVFNNAGVLEDNFGSLSGIITNNRLIAQSVQGPLVANVPVPNFMVVGSWSGFNSLGVFINSSGTTSAGSYNKNTNIYVPNSAAAGRSWIYIKIRKNGDLCSSVFRVKILPAPSPIAPPNDPTELVAANTPQMNTAARLYPNPANGAFQIEIPDALSGDCDILIFNTLGQLVHQQQNDFSASPTLSVNAAEKWPPGVYSVKISQNRQPIWQSRLALTR